MTPPLAPPPPPPAMPPTPPPVPPTPPPMRRLRRSATDRVAGGVAGGLGEYFGLDPVLFRVLFAVGAFFGGFGVIAYVVLWLALPEPDAAGTTAIDRLGGWLREHRVPLWFAGAVALFVGWLLFGVSVGSGFGGIRVVPGLFIIAVIVAVVALTRRSHPRRTPPPAGGWPGGPPYPGSPYPGSPYPGATVPSPAYPSSPDAGTPAPGPVAADHPDAAVHLDAAVGRPMVAWYREAREAGRLRRRRSRPLVLGTLGALLVGLVTTAVVDATSGVALPVYAVVGAAIVLAGVVAAAVLRRPAYILTWLLIPALGWFGAFAGTHTSLRDGAGERLVRPTSAADLDGDYRQAFGRLTLDLRGVYAGSSGAPGAVTPAAGAPAALPDVVFVRVGAGQARVIVPPDADVVVRTQVRTGDTTVDGAADPAAGGGGGWRLRTEVPAGGTQGPALTVVLQVTDGEAAVIRTD